MGYLDCSVRKYAILGYLIGQKLLWLQISPFNRPLLDEIETNLFSETRHPVSGNMLEVYCIAIRFWNHFKF